MPTALITGANRGLGREVAETLAKAGYTLVIHGRTEQTAQETLTALSGNGSIWAYDFSNHSFALPELPPLNAMVVNAGIYSEDTARGLEVLRVNLRGPLNLCDALVPKLPEGARVVLVSSGLGELACFTRGEAAQIKGALNREQLQQVAGGFVKGWMEGAGGPSPYAVSKALLNRYTQILAAEHPALRINAVCPGWVRTDMGGKQAPRNVAEGAAGILWAATQATETGGFYRDGELIDW
jgi:NAD(P)-dependent dehydrogenase (short-subunit alcohol dehydrogenase family)